MNSTPLWTKLHPLLEQYQRLEDDRLDNDDNNNEVNSNTNSNKNSLLEQQVAHILLQQQQQHDNEDIVSPTLRHILDCAAAALNAEDASAKALVSLVVHVTCHFVPQRNSSHRETRETIVSDVLTRLLQLAGCVSDKIRAATVERDARNAGIGTAGVTRK